MDNEPSKTDAQIKLEIEQAQLAKKKQYNELTSDYKNLSLKYLKVASFSAALLLIIILIIRYFDSNFLSDVQYFFLFVSLIAYCVSAALHWHYQSSLKDSLSEFSENFSLFAKNKDLNKRIIQNRKTVYINNVPFWIGIFSFLLVILLGLIPSGNAHNSKQPSLQSKKNDGKITIDLLQINDLYEISPLDSDRIGGMARIATLKKQFQNQNENTMLLMAGDFLSPSVFNSVKNSSGERVAGKQIIAAMNAAGVDLATFGNHEFDISYNVLQQRINESGFQWVASNVYHKTASGNILFQKNNIDIPKSWKKTFTNPNGINFTIGFFGLTISDNKGGDPEYVRYDSTLYAASKMYAELASNCDAVIAITHQDLKEDSMLAVAIPQLAAIIGGHEHDMQFEKVENVYISKAHSNAKTAFYLKLQLDRKNNATTALLTPELIPVDTTIKQDYLTKIICERWMDIAMDYFKKSGFSPDQPVCKNLIVKLDGRDAQIRNGQTNLTRLITDAMLWATKTNGCKIAILNAGSIRVDDIITPEITEYSFLRALPYGGAIRIAEMKGWFIKKLISAGTLLKNEGGFVQYSDNLAIGSWSIDNTTIADSASYKVAIADYLITGKQNKLEFVKEGAPGIPSVDPYPLPRDSALYDVRKAVIKYLKNYCGYKKIIDKYNKVCCIF